VRPNWTQLFRQEQTQREAKARARQERKERKRLRRREKERLRRENPAAYHAAKQAITLANKERHRARLRRRRAARRAAGIVGPKSKPSSTRRAGDMFRRARRMPGHYGANQ
jgi:hypothetical protein